MRVLEADAKPAIAPAMLGLDAQDQIRPWRRSSGDQLLVKAAVVHLPCGPVFDRNGLLERGKDLKALADAPHGLSQGVHLNLDAQAGDVFEIGDRHRRDAESALAFGHHQRPRYFCGHAASAGEAPNTARDQAVIWSQNSCCGTEHGVGLHNFVPFAAPTDGGLGLRREQIYFKKFCMKLFL